MATRERSGLFQGLSFPGGKWTARTFGVIVGILAWYLVAIVFPEDLLPFPLEAVEASIELLESGIVAKHLWATISRTIWGFLGATILGVGLGVIMGLSDYGEQFTTPYIVIGLAMPGIAWAAIMTIIFGLASVAPIAATTVTVFPFISLNVWKGVENIDVDLIQMSRSFGVSWPRLIRRTILPSVAPALFTALRIGIAISWKVETNAEIFASKTGVGIRALQAFDGYRYDEAMAWAAIFLVIVVLLEFLVLRPLERKVFEYRPEADFDVVR